MLTPTFKMLLVPVDGSEASISATSLAIRIAKSSGAELLFAHAINRAAIIAECTSAYGGDAASALDTLDDYGKSLLRGCSAQATACGLRARTVLLDGAPAHAIIDLASKSGADGIVMGTSRKDGLERLFIGSTAVGVIRAASVPTFVVHASGSAAVEEEPLFSNIYAAIDRSAPAAAATDYAITLAKAFGSRLTFYHVVEATDVDAAHTGRSGYVKRAARVASEELVADACAKAAAAGVPAQPFVAEGKPHDVLVALAIASKAELVVIGTHGRSGLDHLVFGSVAEKVVQRCTMPVVVLRLPAPASAIVPATA